MRIRRMAVMSCLGLAACGGSGGPPAPVTVVLLSDPAGHGSPNPTGTSFTFGLLVGDTGSSPSPTTFHALITFDRAPIPPGATVTQATLSLGQRAVSGAPFSVLGTLVAEHVTFPVPGPTAADYDTPGVTPGADTVSTDPTLGIRTVDVTARVQADVAAGRPLTQFRLEFVPFDANGDAVDDIVAFEDAANSNATGNVPTLTVVYRP